MTDRIAYTKVTDKYILPKVTVDGNDGPILDDINEEIWGDITPYEISTLFSSDGFVLLDEYGNEIY
jgi:hypothetical protein